MRVSRVGLHRANWPVIRPGICADRAVKIGKLISHEPAQFNVNGYLSVRKPVAYNAITYTKYMAKSDYFSILIGIGNIRTVDRLMKIRVC